MPAGWPGNSVTKLARAKSGGGFESDIASGGGGGDVDLPEANLVVDTFETADMTPILNNAGFSWENNNRTSIVTMDPGPVVVWDNGPIYTEVFDGRDWTAKNGDHCLRFRFQARPFSEAETMAEQRWNLQNSQSDLWIRYWLRVPTNYKKAYLHDAEGNYKSGNDKFLSLWKETYDVKGTCTWQLRPDASGDGAVLNYQDGGVTSGETDPQPLITVPEDRGRWMQLVFHVKSAASYTANDGAIQSWRRWADETEFTLLHNKQDAQLYEDGATDQGFRSSFILGSHRIYEEQNEFLVDDFELSTQPLVPAGTEGL